MYANLINKNYIFLMNVSVFAAKLQITLPQGLHKMTTTHMNKGGPR